MHGALREAMGVDKSDDISLYLMLTQGEIEIVKKYGDCICFENDAFEVVACISGTTNIDTEKTIALFNQLIRG